MYGKEKRTPVLLWLAPALVVFIAGFVFALLYGDWELNVLLYNPKNTFAIFMEAFGWYPSFVPIALLFLLFATQQGRAGRGMNIAGWALYAATIAILFAVSVKYLLGRSVAVNVGFILIVVVCAAVVLALAALCAKKLRVVPTGGLRTRLWFVAWWGTALCAANELVIDLIKLVWNRARFDEIILALGGVIPESSELFTPWFMPLGTGGSSLPSGHTAKAAGILVLVLLCDLLPAFAKKRAPVYAICWAYIAAMGFARIVIGRHYLSDTLAAAGIVALLVFALRHNNFYQKGLRRVLRVPLKPHERNTA